MKADLHVHTTAADGILSPAEVVELAVEVGLDVIAITDHDTVSGIAAALAAARTIPSITVIPGIEISTDVPSGEVHVLGYFIDFTNPELSTALEKLRGSRQARALKMVEKLRTLGMDIEWEQVQEIAKGDSIGRPHIAQALLARGYIDSMKVAFDKYIGRNGPAYVEREKLTPVEAVKLINGGCGLSVLAHPADIDGLEGHVSELKATGLVGIEVYYDGYTSDKIDRLLAVAEKYGLVTTGGSDYHGPGSSCESVIGEALAPAAAVDELFALADKHSLELMRT